MSSAWQHPTPGVPGVRVWLVWSRVGVRESPWENVCVHGEGVGTPLSCRWAFKVSKKQFCFLSDWPPGASSPDLKVVSRS